MDAKNTQQQLSTKKVVVQRSKVVGSNELLKLSPESNWVPIQTQCKLWIQCSNVQRKWRWAMSPTLRSCKLIGKSAFELQSSYRRKPSTTEEVTEELRNHLRPMGGANGRRAGERNSGRCCSRIRNAKNLHRPVESFGHWLQDKFFALQETLSIGQTSWSEQIFCRFSRPAFTDFCSSESLSRLLSRRHYVASSRHFNLLSPVHPTTGRLISARSICVADDHFGFETI